MTVHLKDLSKVYLQNVYESSHNSDDESKMKKSKHKKEEDKEDKEENGEEEGDEPRWQDSDGDGKWYEPGEDVAAPKKKKVTKEGFSNWRNDLIEVIEPERLPSKMKEGKVDNYSGKNKCVTLNPEIKEGVQIIESVELSEEYINETVYGAVDYFMAEGLNDEGVEILIDELGLDEFVSFVFEIGNEVLTEARTLLGKKKNPQKLPKGTAPSQVTKAAVAKYGTTRRFKSPRTSGVIKKNRPAAKAIEKAKETQTTKRPVRDAIARGVFGAVRAYQQGMKRHNAAMSAARETGKTIAKAAQVGAKGASEFGKGVASGAKATVDAAKKAKKVINAGYEFQIDEKNQGPSTPVKKYDGKFMPNPGAGRVKNVRLKPNHTVNAEGFVLDEKAESEQQQKLFGLALSVKRGQTPRSEASAEVLKIVDSMSEKEIRKFAKTKHEGIPKKVEEELAPTTPQQIAAQKQVAVAQDKLNKANKKALSKNTQVEEYLDEKKIPVTRQSGDFNFPGKTGEEKGIPKGNRLKKSENPADRRRGNKMLSRLKASADSETARASSDARQKLYRGQQRRANDLAQQLIKAKGNVNSGYELEGNLVNETEKPSALDIVRQNIIKKHGAASLMGTPENEAARRAAAAKAKKQPKPSSKGRYKDDVYSTDGLGGIRGYRSGD